MLRFRHNEKLAIFQKLIIASERDPSRDEDRHKMLLRLLADEEAKDKQPDGQISKNIPLNTSGKSPLQARPVPPG